MRQVATRLGCVLSPDGDETDGGLAYQCVSDPGALTITRWVGTGDVPADWFDTPDSDPVWFVASNIGTVTITVSGKERAVVDEARRALHIATQQLHTR